MSQVESQTPELSQIESCIIENDSVLLESAVDKVSTRSKKKTKRLKSDSPRRKSKDAAIKANSESSSESFLRTSKSEPTINLKSPKIIEETLRRVCTASDSLKQTKSKMMQYIVPIKEGGTADEANSANTACSSSKTKKKKSSGSSEKRKQRSGSSSKRMLANSEKKPTDNHKNLDENTDIVAQDAMRFSEVDFSEPFSVPQVEQLKELPHESSTSTPQQGSDEFLASGRSTSRSRRGTRRRPSLSPHRESDECSVSTTEDQDKSKRGSGSSRSRCRRGRRLSVSTHQESDEFSALASSRSRRRGRRASLSPQANQSPLRSQTKTQNSETSSFHKRRALALREDFPPREDEPLWQSCEFPAPSSTTSTEAFDPFSPPKPTKLDSSLADTRKRAISPLRRGRKQSKNTETESAESSDVCEEVLSSPKQGQREDSKPSSGSSKSRQARSRPGRKSVISSPEAVSKLIHGCTSQRPDCLEA